MTLHRRTMLTALTGAVAAFAAPTSRAETRACPSSEAGLKFELYRDEARDYRWRLRSANGNTIAESGEGYRRREDCLRGIELVKSSHAAPVID